jgi:exonuclease SbcD
VRLLHTSDWHLGKRLCDTSLLEDQAHALEQLFAVLKDERIDALLVAGDLYDRSVPPEEAVSLFSEFITRVSRDLKTTVVAISGNHDSPERLGFGADLLARGRVHLRTAIERRAEPVMIETKRARAAIYALPYLDPLVTRCLLEDETIAGHDAAVRAALVAAKAHRLANPVDHAILMAHLFARGGVESADSERPLVVGGAAHVGADALDGFGYVALGHLHAPQKVAGRDDIRYCGSLLKYSFGEANHTKGFDLVEFILGRATVRRIPLSPRRELVRIEGSFDELLSDARFAHAESAFVEATYTDTAYLIDVASRLRARFPHLLVAQSRLLLEAGMTPASGEPARELDLHRDTRDLLRGFFRHVTGDEALDEEHLLAFESALEHVSGEPSKRAEVSGAA